jgi:hypothetical protein
VIQNQIYIGVELLFIIRYAYAAVTLYIYYKVAAMIFNLVSYGINFYLSRPRGTKTGIRIGTLENKK